MTAETPATDPLAPTERGGYLGTSLILLSFGLIVAFMGAGAIKQVVGTHVLGGFNRQVYAEIVSVQKVPENLFRPRAGEKYKVGFQFVVNGHPYQGQVEMLERPIENRPIAIRCTSALPGVFIANREQADGLSLLIWTVCTILGLLGFLVAPLVFMIRRSAPSWLQA